MERARADASAQQTASARPSTLDGFVHRKNSSSAIDCHSPLSLDVEPREQRHPKDHAI